MKKNNDGTKGSLDRMKEFRRILLRMFDIILIGLVAGLLLLVFFLVLTNLPEQAPAEDGNSPIGNALLSLFIGILVAMGIYNMTWGFIKRLFRKHDQVLHYKPILNSGEKERNE